MDQLDREVEAFAASEWVEATLTQADAEGLCKRATLAFLVQLEAAGLAGRVELWRLSWAIEGMGRGPEGYNTHWVLLRHDEVIDVSPRQFEPNTGRT